MQGEQKRIQTQFAQLQENFEKLCLNRTQENSERHSNYISFLTQLTQYQDSIKSIAKATQTHTLTATTNTLLNILQSNNKEHFDETKATKINNNLEPILNTLNSEIREIIDKTIEKEQNSRKKLESLQQKFDKLKLLTATVISDAAQTPIFEHYSSVLTELMQLTEEIEPFIPAAPLLNELKTYLAGVLDVINGLKKQPNNKELFSDINDSIETAIAALTPIISSHNTQNKVEEEQRSVIRDRTPASQPELSAAKPIETASKKLNVSVVTPTTTKFIETPEPDSTAETSLQKLDEVDDTKSGTATSVERADDFTTRSQQESIKEQATTPSTTETPLELTLSPTAVSEDSYPTVFIPIVSSRESLTSEEISQAINTHLATRNLQAQTDLAKACRIAHHMTNYDQGYPFVIKLRTAHTDTNHVLQQNQDIPVTANDVGEITQGADIKYIAFHQNLLSVDAFVSQWQTYLDNKEVLGISIPPRNPSQQTSLWYTPHENEDAESVDGNSNRQTIVDTQTNNRGDHVGWVEKIKRGFAAIGRFFVNFCDMIIHALNATPDDVKNENTETIFYKNTKNYDFREADDIFTSEVSN